MKQRRCRSQWRHRWRNARLATVWVWVRPGAFRLIWEDIAVPWWKEFQPSIMNTRSDCSQSDDAQLNLDCPCTIERESHRCQLVYCRCTCKIDTAQLPIQVQQLLSLLHYLIADRMKKLVSATGLSRMLYDLAGSAIFKMAAYPIWRHAKPEVPISACRQDRNIIATCFIYVFRIQLFNGYDKIVVRFNRKCKI